MTNPASSAASYRNRTIAYWVTTVSIAAELAVGGVWGIPNVLGELGDGAVAGVDERGSGQDGRVGPPPVCRLASSMLRMGIA